MTIVSNDFIMILSNEKKEYRTVRIIPKSNINILERDKIDTPNTQIHDCLLVWLGIGTSITSGGDNLVLWAQTSPLKDINYSHIVSPKF